MPDNHEETVKAVGDEELSRAVAEKTVELKKSEAAKMSEFEAVRRKNGEGHRERLKQRFIRSGIKGLEPHEMLELLLFYTVPRRDTKPIAYELLRRFGSMAGVLNADPVELMQVDFVTENAAVLFKLIPQLAAICGDDTEKGIPCMNCAVLAEMFRNRFAGVRTEKTMFACFDADLRLLSITEIGKGDAAHSPLGMKKLLTEALRTECTMAALAHNHPDASPVPSDEDIADTRRICSVLRDINVRLMDHIIVGGERVYSMRDSGDLGIFD